MNRDNFNGALLTLLRKAEGLTQKELCANIAVTQGNLSKIEQGLFIPDDRFIEKVAACFRVTRNFFFQDERSYAPATPYHRSRATLQMKTRDFVEARANLYRIFLQKMLGPLELTNSMPFLPPNEAIGFSPQEIARLIRKNLDVPEGPIANLSKLVEKNGIFIIMFNFGTEELDGFTLIGPNVVPIIFLNSAFPGGRMRFTLAHELGHYIMHQDDSLIRENIEKDANEFASALLMPEYDIKDELLAMDTRKLNVYRLLALKQRWQVSMNALLKRASDLGVLTKNQQQYLWIQMSQLHYRTQEPNPLPLEKTSLLNDLLNTYKNDLAYSDAELAAFLNISESLYSEYFISKNLTLHMKNQSLYINPKH
jgi:Zn-dependent peptidase ImmA (M78 family)/transcriptional regulator with XRE-family HTH domain